MLNLSFLSNQDSSLIISEIMKNGGLAHLIGAIQKSFQRVDLVSLQYAIKSIGNLAMSGPSISVVLGEFGALDVFVDVVKTFYASSKEDQIQILHHSLLVIQTICTLNLNKNQLLEKTIFTTVCRHIIKNHASTDENGLKILLSVMAQISIESI
jgi:hypothetical protein